MSSDLNHDDPADEDASEGKAARRGNHPTEKILYTRLVDGIIDKRLRPGQHLNEWKLAQAYDVPRSRVRRVLERLREERVVEIRLNQGAFVSRPTVEEAFQVFEARSHLECVMVRLACLRATKDDLARLRKHLRAEEEIFAAGRTDVNRIAGEFHSVVAAIGRNRILEHQLNSLIRRGCLIQSVYEKVNGTLCLTHEHAKIVDYIEANEPERAVKEMEIHFNHVLDHLDLTEKRQKEVNIYES